jgi:protocadherin Fat 4
VAGALDYETTTSYTLTVTASHGVSTSTVTVAVTVTDVDEPPTFGAASYAFSVAEDAAVAAAVGTVAATGTGDAGVSHSITAGNAGAAFAIDGTSGAITVAGALDYETTASYPLTVQAVQGASDPVAVRVAVTITDVAEPPTFGAASYAFSVAEDAAVAAAVGTVTATARANGAVSYAITAGNTAGAFALDASTGAITVAGALDYEATASYPLTVTASHGVSTTTVTVTITVTDVEEPPGFGAASYAFSVAEDAAVGAAVGRVTATGSGDGAISYAITAGNGGAAFALDASTGALTVAGALDHETTASYPLTVAASQGETALATVAVTVTVTNVVEPPVFGAASYAFSVAEDVGIPTTAGTVTATDPEGGDVLYYDITGGNEALDFAVDALAGRVVVGALLDYETTASYTLTVRAIDGEGDAATVAVTITVTDVAEPPTFGETSYTFTVAEDAAEATAVGTVTASVRANGAVSYAITAGNTGDAFAIDADSGAITVASALDHDTTASYTLTVTASHGVSTSTVTVTITVTEAE